MAAFAFAKLKFPKADLLLKLFLATMMIPTQVTIIPLFVVMNKMSLINSYASVILPSIFRPFAVFLLVQQMRTIPNDYLDAASIDGGSTFTVYFKVALPLCAPTLATLSITTFMESWNDYLWPLLMLPDKTKMTLPIALSTLNGQFATEYNVLMAGSLISMIPIGIVGVFFKDTVEQIFGSGLLVVGCMLLLTAALLAFSYYAKPRQKESISMKDAFIIGLAQACAVMPGLSRSGSTIATGLLLGNNKAKLAQFSFLMVIPPILGEALLDVMKMVKGEDVAGDIPALSLAVGFVAAFVSGCVACKWMINIVKKGKLIYFAIYCAIAGLVTIACTLLK